MAAFLCPVLKERDRRSRKGQNYIVDEIFKIFGQPVGFNWQVFSLFLAHVAQSVEHFLGKEEVIGSNPIVGSRKDVNINNL